MNDNFIRVTQREEAFWTVVRGPSGLDLLTFRRKAHATSYARALCHAGNLALFIDDQFGFAVEQETATLTYPCVLN